MAKIKSITTKIKAFYAVTVNPDVKYEWEHKEYGSWEDHGCPSTGHVVCILKNSPKTRIVCKTKEDAILLSISASYQQDWGSENSLVQRLEKFAAKVERELSQIL